MKGDWLQLKSDKSTELVNLNTVHHLTSHDEPALAASSSSSGPAPSTTTATHPSPTHQAIQVEGCNHGYSNYDSSICLHYQFGVDDGGCYFIHMSNFNIISVDIPSSSTLHKLFINTTLRFKEAWRSNGSQKEVINTERR